MVSLGYALSSEEHSAPTLVKLASQAEKVGFEFALISDHFHPWIDQQGQSPFVWDVIGAISQVTTRLIVGTGVTCPTIRLHPAIVAQAAATAATLLPRRFWLGLGTGENLNEHILADSWPSYQTRQEMLVEAVNLIRQLWQGGYQNFDGCYYSLDTARIYSLPQILPPIMIAAGGPQSASMALDIGDGLIATSPDSKLTQKFVNTSMPRIGQLSVCYHPDPAVARQTALKWWPNAAFKGPLNSELRLPSYFAQVATMVKEEEVAAQIVCDPNPKIHLQKIQEYIDAGFTHIYFHQVGPDQEAFFDFYRTQILPHFR
jgi:G6PDH family F420-dependent oxidoreductase